MALGRRVAHGLCAACLPAATRPSVALGATRPLPGPQLAQRTVCPAWPTRGGPPATARRGPLPGARGPPPYVRRAHSGVVRGSAWCGLGAVCPGAVHGPVAGVREPGTGTGASAGQCPPARASSDASRRGQWLRAPPGPGLGKTRPPTRGLERGRPTPDRRRRGARHALGEAGLGAANPARCRQGMGGLAPWRPRGASLVADRALRRGRAQTRPGRGRGRRLKRRGHESLDTGSAARSRAPMGRAPDGRCTGPNRGGRDRLQAGAASLGLGLGPGAGYRSHEGAARPPGEGSSAAGQPAQGRAWCGPTGRSVARRKARPGRLPCLLLAREPRTGADSAASWRRRLL